MARLTKISATLSFQLTEGGITSSYSIDHQSQQGFFFIGLEDKTHIHKLTLEASEALRLLHHLEEFEDAYLARRDRAPKKGEG